MICASWLLLGGTTVRQRPASGPLCGTAVVPVAHPFQTVPCLQTLQRPKGYGQSTLLCVPNGTMRRPIM